MDIESTLSVPDATRLHAQIEAFNASLNGSRTTKQELGKDDFLQILITQLQHQDPTKPMEDREFIAQMAQFSSLEQMTNMNRQFAELSAALKSSLVMNLLGKEVEIHQGEEYIRGSVEAITAGFSPQVLVNGNYYDYEKISKVNE
ncbi:Flagellar basal-body rod modification protein FlgD [Olavius algarvensis spirochete endosymbiont]|uniref:flagellar hook assembly protein FlgD n=1 Tax=Olavius algarvensis spirochete endosymbiont TaxID=260710 RepID=UPI00052BB722|nr:flagellar hook assembly protein FlgD [Olavius algarvensis spirochete endosymbiont]KGM42634.1 flagellar basal body rod modification protein FlgD [Alkalispirochaeta odontotermitis]VDA99344.1 Flagellar basal-body rod modification protein FlgD [Olavius algarvensis spirochete endosymbiont]